MNGCGSEKAIKQKTLKTKTKKQKSKNKQKITEISDVKIYFIAYP